MAPAGEPAGGPAPLVTVVIATYNSAVTLAPALASVQRQTFQDFEVWVVGDACTDGSEAVVAAAGDPRLRWINLARNSGSQTEPNNEGQRRARGRYVAYLGHDDLWFPWHLATIVDVATREQAALAHGLGVMIGPDAIWTSGPPRPGASYRGHFVPPTNWLVERAWLERIGGWRRPGDLGRPIDVDVLDRVAATGARIACASRLTTVKFPSPLWRSYAADAERPQIAMAEAMAADPEGLAVRLLGEVVSAHARLTLSVWAPPPRQAWRDAALHVRRAIGASLRVCEDVPLLSTLLRWRFQWARRRARVRRGLAT